MDTKQAQGVDLVVPPRTGLKAQVAICYLGWAQLKRQAYKPKSKPDLALSSLVKDSLTISHSWLNKVLFFENERFWSCRRSHVTDDSIRLHGIRGKWLFCPLLKVCYFVWFCGRDKRSSFENVTEQTIAKSRMTKHSFIEALKYSKSKNGYVEVIVKISSFYLT